MSNLVIVAIPDENDRVWKVSSEKIPHMTLLFLGDTNQVANLDQILGFVEHAASMTLSRFYLPVDRRDVLGPDEADVLFFKKGRYDYKAIRDFRASLLQDNNIKTAYDSATQFEGPWQPHLTLGYPASPAKSMPDDQNGTFFEVSFNKIAVWTDDFDGPEFLLKDYWDEFEALAVAPMDVAMSGLTHAAKVSDTPWSNFKDSDYDDAQYARACLLDRGADAGTAKQRYSIPVREPDGTLNRNGCHAAAAVLSSTGGTGSARGNKIKNATDAQIASARKKLVSLYNGPLNEDVPQGLGGEMKQTDELGAEFVLTHHGVKGMRWGVRKEAVSSGAQSVGTAAKSAGGAVGKAAKAAGRFAGDVQFESRTQPRSDGLGGQIESKAREMIIDAAHPKFQKEDLPALKARHPNAGFKNRLLKPLSKEARAYRKDARETYINRLEKTANSMKNPSGTREYTIRERGGDLPNTNYGWEVSSRQVQHAASDFTLLDVLMDDEGYITGLKKSDNSMAQTAELGAEFLSHYGIKGMRWGVRRAQAVTTQTHIDTGLRKRQTKVQAKGGESQPAHEDAVKAATAKQIVKKSGTDALSTQQLRELANRLQVENQVGILMSSKGRRFVEQQIQQEGKQALKKGAVSAAPRVLKKAKKGAATAAAVGALAV